MIDSQTPDPMQPLLVEILRRLLCDEKVPITWVIGEEWVVYHGGDQWSIGPDEPATREQVCGLLVLSGGVYELQNY